MCSPADHETILMCSLFQGVTQKDLPEALAFLGAFERSYPKNGMVFMIGDPIKYAGLLLEGTVELSFLDENANSVNMNHFTRGSLFGESLACAGSKRSPVQLRALSECRILFFNLSGLLRPELPKEGFRAVLAANLLRVFARQNVFLNQKVRIISQKKLRDRLRVYLSEQPVTGDGRITVRFNRNELAEFLGANRSALSRELSNLQNEGILTVSGPTFHIADRQFLFPGRSAE